MNRPIWNSVLILLVLSGVACQESPTPPSEQGTEAQQEQRPVSDEPGHASEQQGENGQHEGKEPADIIVAPEALEGQTFQTAVVERRVIREGIQATANIRPNEY